MLGMVHCCSAFFFSLQLQSNSCKLHPDKVMEKKILRDSPSRMQLRRSRRRNGFSNSRDCSAWGSPGCPASVMYLTLLFRNMRLMLIVSASSLSIIAPRSLLPPRRNPTPNTLCSRSRLTLTRISTPSTTWRTSTTLTARGENSTFSAVFWRASSQRQRRLP